MRQFRHYIFTRFNTGLFGPKSRAKIPPDQWMQHRMKLFMNFTLPSMKNQSCQNFTWLLAMDRRTPKQYIEKLESACYPNMQICYNDLRRNIVPGDYDLITTRIDNDDALGRDAIKVIQDTWREQRPEPWMLIYTYGFILNLATKQMLFMEYRLNNCTTLIEDAHRPQTIWRWKHTELTDIEKCYISDRPYWLQVIHSQNLMNQFPTGHPAQIIREDVSARLDYLKYFGIDAENLPTL